MKVFLRKIARLAGVVAVACLVIMFVSDQIVANNAKGKVFSDIERRNPIFV